MTLPETAGARRSLGRLLALAPGLILAALVLVSGSLISPTHEPSYGGKPVTAWLDAGQEDASFALPEIGPPALPYILAKLAREDPEYAQHRIYTRLWAHLPSSVRRALLKPPNTIFDETRAVMALRELGPGIIPNLARELLNQNPARRKVCAEVLGGWRQGGKNIAVAVPFLTAALRDPDPRVARSAAQALGTPLSAP
jgi:HEAT repeat protein